MDGCRAELGVSENGGTLFSGPYNQDPTIKGTILGSPIFGISQLAECWFSTARMFVEARAGFQAFEATVPKEWRWSAVVTQGSMAVEATEALLKDESLMWETAAIVKAVLYWSERQPQPAMKPGVVPNG